MRTADIQHQIAVNVDPHVIVAGEEEFDGDFLAGVFPHNHVAVFCKRKFKLQLGAKAVVVLGGIYVTTGFVKREETMRTVRSIAGATVKGGIVYAIPLQIVAFGAVLFEVQ